MADPIARNSSVPLSRAQTRENPADTREVSSPATANASASRRSAEAQLAKADAEAAEFGKSTIKVVEKAVRKPEFDTADHVSANSAYLPPDGGRPI